MLRICPRRRSASAAAAIRVDAVPGAAGVRTASERRSGDCTIWATPSRGGHGILRSPIRSIVASDAACTSTSTWKTWPCPRATTHTGWSTPLCDWWWRTACPIDRLPGTYGAIIGCSSPSRPFRTGSKRGEKRAAEYVAGEFLDQALADFSGYIAADELYDGPFCVLSIVDNRTFKRILYEVLDHDPTHEDIRRFFRRFKTILDARSLSLAGITTDASQLYPTPIADVFGAVQHQICEFHTIAEINKAVLRAVAKVRKALAARVPKLGRGRPTRQTRKVARRRKRMLQRIADLFDHRHLFVQHGLSPAEKKTLHRITRGLQTVYRVRSQEHIAHRIALDMQREAQTLGRDQATATLHLARAG